MRTRTYLTYLSALLITAHSFAPPPPPPPFGGAICFDTCGSKSFTCAAGFGDAATQLDICRSVDWAPGCTDYGWVLRYCNPVPPETPEVGWRFEQRFEQAWYCMGAECTGS